MGLLGAIVIGIGGMVGGGIFAVLSVVALEAGGAAPLAFLIAGVIAALSGYSYAKFSVAQPSRGGTVIFIDRAFGVGLLTGAANNLLWLGYIVTLALYAVAFANYGATFFVGEDTPGFWLEHGLITLAIVLPTAINLISVAVVARTETAVVLVKLGILWL